MAKTIKSCTKYNSAIDDDIVITDILSNKLYAAQTEASIVFEDGNKIML